VAWNHPAEVVLLCSTLLLFALFAYLEGFGMKSPLLPLHLFRSLPILKVLLCTALITFARNQVCALLQHSPDFLTYDFSLIFTFHPISKSGLAQHSNWILTYQFLGGNIAWIFICLLRLADLSLGAIQVAPRRVCHSRVYTLFGHGNRSHQ